MARSAETDDPAEAEGGFKILAHFRPQAWINDYAVDIDGSRSVDVTDVALHLFLSDRIYLDNFTDCSDDADLLVDVEALGHSGPFEVEAVQAICSAFGVESLAEIDRSMLEAAARRRGILIPVDKAGQEVVDPAKAAIAELKLDLAVMQAENSDVFERLYSLVDGLRPGIDEALTEDFFDALDGLKGEYSAGAVNNREDVPIDPSDDIDHDTETDKIMDVVDGWIAENMDIEVDVILLHNGPMKGASLIEAAVASMKQTNSPKSPAP